MTPVYGQMPSREFTRALHVAIQCGWPPRIIAREPDSGSGSRDLHAGQGVRPHGRRGACGLMFVMVGSETTTSPRVVRSEEHTSELQSRLHLVCRLLLEKKKNKIAYAGAATLYLRAATSC